MRFLLTILLLLSGAVYAAPGIELSERTWDFGRISAKGGKVKKEITVTNTGDSPLLIQSVEVACTCTKVEYPKQPILPGASATILITVNPRGQQGSFIRTVNIFNNSGDFRQIVVIKGTITVR